MKVLQDMRVKTYVIITRTVFISWCSGNDRERRSGAMDALKRNRRREPPCLFMQISIFYVHFLRIWRITYVDDLTSVWTRTDTRKSWINWTRIKRDLEFVSYFFFSKETPQEQQIVRSNSFSIYTSRIGGEQKKNVIVTFILSRNIFLFLYTFTFDRERDSLAVSCCI